MAFHEVRFPVSVALGATGGPERRTEIVTLGSGFEERNTRWAHSRRRFNAGYGIRSLDDIHEVIRFFEGRRGRLHAFRWKDHADFKSCAPGGQVAPDDQVIGTGDGATGLFQLVKEYSSALNPYGREIKKPVAGTIRVAVDGVEQSEETQFIADETSGLVTFQPGHVPAAGVLVTAGFEFDVPARFDTDYLEINLAAFEAGDIPSIPVVEVRL